MRQQKTKKTYPTILFSSTSPLLSRPLLSSFLLALRLPVRKRSTCESERHCWDDWIQVGLGVFLCFVPLFHRPSTLWFTSLVSAYERWPCKHHECTEEKSYSSDLSFGGLWNRGWGATLIIGNEFVLNSSVSDVIAFLMKYRLLRGVKISDVKLKPRLFIPLTCLFWFKSTVCVPRHSLPPLQQKRKKEKVTIYTFTYSGTPGPEPTPGWEILLICRTVFNMN